MSASVHHLLAVSFAGPSRIVFYTNVYDHNLGVTIQRLKASKLLILEDVQQTGPDDRIARIIFRTRRENPFAEKQNIQRRLEHSSRGCLLLDLLADVGWQMITSGAFLQERFQNTIIFRFAGGRTVRHGCSVDNGRGDRFVIIPSSAGDPAASGLADRLAHRGFDPWHRQILAPSGKVDFEPQGAFYTVKILTHGHLETKERTAEVYLGLAGALESSGFRVDTTANMFGDEVDAVVFHKDPRDSAMKPEPRVQHFWGLNLSSHPYKFSPGSLAGLNLIADPPGVKTLVLKSIVANLEAATAHDATGSNGVNHVGASQEDDDADEDVTAFTKFWTPRDICGKWLATTLMRDLLLQGWHLRLSLNGIFDHSVLLFSRTDTVGPVGTSGVDACMTAEVAQVSVLSQKKLSITMVTKNNRGKGKNVEHTLLQAKLNLDTLHLLKPLNGSLKREEKFFRFPLGTFSSAHGCQKGFEILLRVVAGLWHHGWRLHGAANLSGVARPSARSANVGRDYRDSWCHTMFMLKDAEVRPCVLNARPLYIHVYEDTDGGDDRAAAGNVMA